MGDDVGQPACIECNNGGRAGVGLRRSLAEGLEPGGVAVADGDERRPRDRPVDEGSSVLGPHASQAHDPESDVGHVRSADRREAC